ncbi:MAG: c-type cytochrome [Planctomycetaceae bacterium]|nr:c-type cytochrome [Planctomycetaceae bacterium]
MLRWLVLPFVCSFAVVASAKEPAATPPELLKVAKGFRVELLYSVPMATQGSWVNLCVDPKGRLIASDQYGGLYRVTPPPVGSTGGEIKIEPIPVAIGESQGLVWAFDSLYVVVNSGGGKFKNGVHRVRDANGDDVLDTVETLRILEGKTGEHGPHAILPTADGQGLYVVVGNQSPITQNAKTRVPPVWGEDHLLPRMPDGRGFMKDVLGPGGAIYRIDPDGKEWEVVSVGYRNQFDAAVNRDGELFTYDADMEWDINTPWYRPTRICHVTSGSEFGWRNGAGKRPAYYLDSTPAAIDIGPGSPTGIAFGYGAKFPTKYQAALFICDWSYGKLYAVHLKPVASTYTGTVEEFVTGTPLPLTDLVINPTDGAMYFAIGGRKTTSGLYRVTYAGDEATSPSQPAVDPQTAAARAVRHKLEAFHGVVDPTAVETTWPYLGHNDRFLRNAALAAIEAQPVASWKERALAEQHPIASIHALLALVQCSAPDPLHRKLTDPAADPQLFQQILAALDRIDWTSLDKFGNDVATIPAAHRTDLVRLYQILLNRFGPPDAATQQKLVAKFEPLFPAASKELDSELGQLLVYLQAPSAAPKLVKLLQQAPTQEEQIDIARSLRMLRTGWTPDLRKPYFDWFHQAAGYRGGASFGLFVANIKKDAMATLTPEELSALKPILDAQPTQQITQAVAAPRKFVKEWKLDELVAKAQAGLKSRDFSRGQAMFAAANCFACHRYDNQGGALGPDLTNVAGRFSPRDLLESIVDPNKVISDQYAAVTIVTDDGKSVTGRIVNLNGDTLKINTNMLEPDEQATIDRRKIEEMLPSKTSMMPAGLLNTLEEAEILDLLAYVLSRADRGSPMFGGD